MAQILAHRPQRFWGVLGAGLPGGEGSAISFPFTVGSGVSSGLGWHPSCDWVLCGVCLIERSLRGTGNQAARLVPGMGPCV